MRKRSRFKGPKPTSTTPPAVDRVRVEVHSLDPAYDDTNYPHELAEKWGVSRDEVNFHGVFGSAEEAANEGSPYIGKYYRPRVLGGIDVTAIIEQITLQDEWSIEAAEDSLLPTPEQTNDLESRIRRCVSEWMTQHDLWPKWALVNDIVDTEYGKGGE